MHVLFFRPHTAAPLPPGSPLPHSSVQLRAAGSPHPLRCSPLSLAAARRGGAAVRSRQCSQGARVLHRTLPPGSDFSIPTRGTTPVSVYRSPTPGTGCSGEHVASLGSGGVRPYSSNYTERLDPSLINGSLVIRGLRPGDGGIYTVCDERNKSVVLTINLTVSTATTTAVYSTNTTDPKGPRGRSSYGLVLAVLVLLLLVLIWKWEAIKCSLSTRCRWQRRCQARPTGALEAEELEMAPLQMDTQQHKGGRTGSSPGSDVGSSMCQAGGVTRSSEDHEWRHASVTPISGFVPWGLSQSQMTRAQVL